jgi:ankyrin repeat protein
MDNHVCDTLHMATKNGHDACVRMLLSNDFKSGFDNINKKDNNGWTPLHYSASYGHINCIRILLSTENNNSNTVDVKTYGNWTPLHFASQNGHTDCVRTLLEYGANSDEKLRLDGLHFIWHQIMVIMNVFEYCPL